jgi:hypothetical protein
LPRLAISSGKSIASASRSRTATCIPRWLATKNTARLESHTSGASLLACGARHVGHSCFTARLRATHQRSKLWPQDRLQGSA